MTRESDGTVPCGRSPKFELTNITVARTASSIMGSNDLSGRNGLMKFSLTGYALFLAALLLIGSSTTVSAARVVSFTDLFNSASDTYTALQNAATAHNTFVKHHSSACASEHGKWWVSKVPQDLAQVGRLQSRLSQASAAQKKKAVYRDVVKTAHDLKHWTQTAITPRLDTCKVMAAQSSKVDLDLSNVCNDLNCGTY